MVRSVAGVRELLAVGRDLELVAAAKRERRRVVSARGEIARRAAGERNVNDVRPRRLLPRFPMAIEKVGDDASLGRFLLRRSRFVLDARRIDAAIGINVGNHDDARAIRHPLHAASAALQIGQLACGAGFSRPTG